VRILPHRVDDKWRLIVYYESNLESPFIKNYMSNLVKAQCEKEKMMERTKNIDVSQVYKLWEQYANTCNKGDFESWMTLWIEDGIQMAPDAPPRIGKEQIRTAMQPSFDLFDMRKMVIHTAEIRILGDTAYSHGTYTFEMTPKAGGETMQLSGKFLDILAKQANGSWKIAIDCHNYNEPAG
jgi:uncharacterized protein (TIGR02246 family)